eukprot:scaffold28351_cov52-Phaeocystis_antarctica.AAC.1
MCPAPRPTARRSRRRTAIIARPQGLECPSRCEGARIASEHEGSVFRITSPVCGCVPGAATASGRMADGLLEAVRELWLADPSLGPKPLLAKLRELQPDLEAGTREVREALTALKAENEATEAAAA